MSNNKIVVDLNKVQFAYLRWHNGKGSTALIHPDFTVNGIRFEPTECAYPHPDFPCETNLQRANRLGIVDYWEPRLHLQLTANHSLTYTGQKALELWKAWNTKIFSKQKKDK